MILSNGSINIPLGANVSSSIVQPSRRGLKQSCQGNIVIDDRVHVIRVIEVPPRLCDVKYIDRMSSRRQVG